VSKGQRGGGLTRLRVHADFKTSTGVCLREQVAHLLVVDLKHLNRNLRSVKTDPPPPHFELVLVVLMLVDVAENGVAGDRDDALVFPVPNLRTYYRLTRRIIAKCAE
jgi:hypothetical protein